MCKYSGHYYQRKSIAKLNGNCRSNFSLLGSSYSITAQGASTYTWNNNAIGAQYTGSALTTTGRVTYTVQLQGTGPNGCVSTKIISVSVWVNACEDVVGITEYANSDQLKIYSNPVNEIVNVEFSNSYESINTEIKIIDWLGREILSVKNAKQIHVSELPKGVYFIKIGNQVRVFLKE